MLYGGSSRVRGRAGTDALPGLGVRSRGATSARIITAVLRMEGGNFSGAKSVGAEYRSCGWALAPDTESISAEMGTS